MNIINNCPGELAAKKFVYVVRGCLYGGELARVTRLALSEI